MGSSGNFRGDSDDIIIKGNDGTDEGVKIDAITDDDDTVRLAVDAQFSAPSGGLEVAPGLNLKVEFQKLAELLQETVSQLRILNLQMTVMSDIDLDDLEGEPENDSMGDMF